MAVKYQIFISSTFEDLKDERDAVIRAVLEMGHIPVGMEMFSAADEEQWQIIRRHIDESDYYVVVVAHRYGSLTGGISYTRKEFEYAVAAGVPVLGFIIEPDAPWPADRQETSEDSKSLLDEFKALIRQRPIGTWRTAEELYAKAAIALMKAFNSQPREGWVRGGSAQSPAVAAEITRLSAENAALRAAAAAAASSAAADESRLMQELRSTLRSVKENMSYRMKGEDEWRHFSRPISLLWIFEIIGPSLVPEYSVDDIASLVALHLAGTTAEEAKESGEIDLADELSRRRSDIVPINLLKETLAKLMAFDLVGPSTVKHSVTDASQYWSLRPRGIDFLNWTTRQSLLVEAAESSDESDSDADDGEKRG